MDKFIDNLSKILNKLQWIDDAIQALYKTISNSFAWKLCIISFILLLLLPIEYYSYIIPTSLSVYILYLLTLYNQHKIDKENIELLDFSYFEAKADETEDVLDGFINECFTRYLVLFRAYKDMEYINEKEETVMRKELLDMIVSSLSPLFLKKMRLYYGSNTETVISQKAFIKVTLFVANNNKNINMEQNTNEKLQKESMDKIFRELMTKPSSDFSSDLNDTPPYE